MSILKHLMKVDHIAFFLMLPAIIMMYYNPSLLWFLITLGLWVIAVVYDAGEHFVKKKH